MQLLYLKEEKGWDYLAYRAVFLNPGLQGDRRAGRQRAWAPCKPGVLGFQSWLWHIVTPCVGTSSFISLSLREKREYSCYWSYCIGFRGSGHTLRCYKEFCINSFKSSFSGKSILWFLADFSKCKQKGGTVFISCLLLCNKLPQNLVT